MHRLRAMYDRIDIRLSRWMARHGIGLLRISLGIVFLWFGILKFFPGLSPAEDLTARTVTRLSLGLLSPTLALALVAALETVIGLGLVTGRALRFTLLLLAFQMLGTVTPLFLFPGEAFTVFPYAPTLEGQYIIKNLVLVSAGIVLGATVRGGRLIADPGPVETAQPATPGRLSSSLRQVNEVR